MPDTFYTRLDFYRLLNAGISDLPELARTLRVTIRTLKRWQESYDPVRISGGSLPDGVEGDSSSDAGVLCAGTVSAEVAVPAAVDPREKSAYAEQLSDREEILKALRREALDGNVQAAKLLLSEYEGSRSGGEDEVLTIEQAVELLREWSESLRSPQ